MRNAPKKRRRNKDIILAGATNKKQRDNRVSYTRYSSSTGAVGEGADDVYTCDISWERGPPNNKFHLTTLGWLFTEIHIGSGAPYTSQVASRVYYKHSIKLSNQGSHVKVILPNILMSLLCVPNHSYLRDAPKDFSYEVLCRYLFWCNMLYSRSTTFSKLIEQTRVYKTGFISAVLSHNRVCCYPC